MEPSRRNFILGVIHESLWGAGTGLFLPATLLPLALVDLGQSASAAGILAALGAAGITLPQAFSALAFPPRFTHPRYLALLHVPTLLGPLAAGLGFWFLPPGAAAGKLAFLYGGFGLFGFGIGLVAPHWIAFIGRVIPAGKRGRYFGTSFFGSGLAATATGWMGARWASQGGLEWGYAVCFLCAVPFMTASVWVLTLMRPLTAEPQPPPPRALRNSFKHLWERLVRPGPIRVGMALTVLMIVLSSAMNLFTVYVREQARLDAAWFQVFTPAVTLGGMGGAFLLGALADHRGLRAAYTLVFAAGLTAVTVMAAVAAGSSPIWPALAFACSGTLNAAFPVVNSVMVLEMAGGKESTVQQGLFATLMGPWNLVLPVLSGWAAGSLGYSWVFGAGAAAAAAGFWVLAVNRSLDMKK